MQTGMDGVTLEPVPVHPRIQRVQDSFSQDWEIYNVLVSPLKLASYFELDTVYNTEDLYNMLEVIQVNREIEAVAHIQAKLAEGNK